MLVRSSYIKTVKALWVDGDVASFTAGLGPMLEMPACAESACSIAVFSVHMLGYHYGIAQCAFLIHNPALVVSVGTVRVPGLAAVANNCICSIAQSELVVVFTFQSQRSLTWQEQ